MGATEPLVPGVILRGLLAAQRPIEFAHAAAVLLYGIGTHGVTSTISRVGACRRRRSAMMPTGAQNAHRIGTKRTLHITAATVLMSNRHDRAR